jgi:hypothetical protein
MEIWKVGVVERKKEHILKATVTLVTYLEHWEVTSTRSVARSLFCHWNLAQCWAQNRWMNRQTDRWTDGHMGGQMDGWTDI